MKFKKTLTSLLLILSLVLALMPGTALADTKIPAAKQLFFVASDDHQMAGWEGLTVSGSQISETPETSYDEEWSVYWGDSYTFKGYVGYITKVNGKKYKGGSIKANDTVTMQPLYCTQALVTNGYSTARDDIDFYMTLGFPMEASVFQVRSDHTMPGYTSVKFTYEGISNEAFISNVESTELKLSSKLTTSKGKPAVKLTWKIAGGSEISADDLDGFEVYRSTKKKSGYGTKPYYKTSKLSYTNTKNLTPGKTYYFKVRGYVKIDGTSYYTAWSNAAYRTIK